MSGTIPDSRYTRRTNMAVGDTGIASLLQSPDVQSALKNVIANNLGDTSMADTSGTTGLGGALGAVLIGALLPRLVGNNGLGVDGVNGFNNHNQLTAADVTTQVGALLSMQDINEVKRDVFQAQAATAAEIATANLSSTTNTLQAEIANLQGQGLLAASIAENRYVMSNEVHEGTANVVAAIDNAAANSLAVTNALAASLAAGHAAIQAGIADSKYATLVAVNNDGDKTRALIEAINLADLNRQITIADNRITELLGDRRTVDSGITVTNNINQNQLQQQQQQQFANINTQLACLASELQRNTQSTVNLGTMTGTAQTANNTRVSG